jgi:hypothetical protein
MNSTNLGLKIFGKNCICTEHAQFFSLSLFLKQYGTVIAYIILGTISNLDDLECKEDVRRFYVILHHFM